MADDDLPDRLRDFAERWHSGTEHPEDIEDVLEAADRLDKAETALEVALWKMHTIASQYEVLYYDPDAGHYMIQTTENSRHHQHEDLLRPRIQLDGRKRLAEGIEHLEDVLGVEPPEELVRESGGGD